MAYAKRLTKERLIQEGFTEITKEGRLFKGEREYFPHWNGKEGNPNRYLCIMIYQRDSEGHLIKGKDRVYKRTRKDGSIRETLSYQGKTETLGLHRVVWAWHYGEVPEGMVVDHISNQHSRIEDYHLDNLQLLTPKQNLAKERGEPTRQVKCQLNRPRSFYEDKLTKYEALYEEAKANHDAKACHQLRTNMAQTRARLRYYDSHIDEVNNIKAETERKKKEAIQMTEFKKDLIELAYWKKTFKENKGKKLWHECCTIEKIVKEKGIEAWPIVKHALDVIHRTFN